MMVLVFAVASYHNLLNSARVLCFYKILQVLIDGVFTTSYVNISQILNMTLKSWRY